MPKLTHNCALPDLTCNATRKKINLDERDQCVYNEKCPYVLSAEERRRNIILKETQDGPDGAGYSGTPECGQELRARTWGDPFPVRVLGQT